MADIAPVAPVSQVVPPAVVPQQVIKKGLVKQVLSGDAVVLQGQAVNGPPPETTVYLSNVTAPRLGRRPTDSSPATADEPFAWEAREFLRKALVGKVITFVKDFTATSGRDHGRIYIGGTSAADAENVAETGVSQGWLEVRQGKIADEYTNTLLALQEQAKAAGLGKWSSTPAVLRQVKWVIENPRELVDNYKQKPVDAVIEMVRDGSTVRAILLPNFEYITLQLSGVRSPATRGGANAASEPFAEEAKFFTESRLLQSDVKIILEGVSNQNFVGSIVHPNGNIAESLLREGYAKCVDWSIGLCTGGVEKLRTQEKAAKEKRLRIWKAYQPSSSGPVGDKKAFTAKVIEVVLSDALVLQKEDGSELKVHLASVRLPREASDDKPSVGRQFRPLYDIPFMFQAREFLRLRLIGKKVSVVIDYVQPKSENFPEKTCATVKIGDVNIAEALIAKGLSRTVRHRNDDENRSSEYDSLLAAEANAEKGKKGLFADKTADKKDTLRIQEIAGDLAKSKQFLPYLQRGGRAEGVVEFVSSGSRLRVYIPKETVVITFLLGGINCPKTARLGPGGVQQGADEPFSNEATNFTKKLLLQHDVEIEVESLDKSGNFVGYLFFQTDGHGKFQNLNELLLEQGLATLHFTAERSSHFAGLTSAETRAKNAKKNIWSTYVEPVETADDAEVQKNDTTERKVAFKKVAVTDIQPNTFKFSAQAVDDAARLEKLVNDLRSTLQSNPPVGGSYVPKRGDLCAARFSVDNLWYRARVESVRSGNAEIVYIDYGNRETVAAASLAQLPGGFATQAPGAREYQLALATIPNNDYASTAYEELANILFSVPFVEINVEYKVGSTEFVQVVAEFGGQKQDIAKTLIEDGYALAEKRREHRLQNLVKEYQVAETTARKNRRLIWEFGDFTGNEI